MNFIFSEKAKCDVSDIGNYIAQDNPIRAESFTDALTEAAHKIFDFPKGYYLFNKRLNIRRKIHGNYAIYYHLSKTQITILRVVHSARKTTSKDLT